MWRPATESDDDALVEMRARRLYERLGFVAVGVSMVKKLQRLAR